MSRLRDRYYMIFLGFHRSFSRQLALGACLLFAPFQGALSQAPETFVQALSRHGVALTKPALVDALRNADKEVRGLAAAELAELKAAEVEPDTLTKVNIAAAATWLGSSDGLTMLKRMCADSTLPPYARQNAARNVFDKGDHACFSAVAYMMLPSADPDRRIGAIYLLSQLHDRTEDESKRILQLLVASLADPDLRMRLEICQGLRWLNKPESIGPLRDALATEREEVVRTQMQSTLDSLVNRSRK